MTTGAEPRQLSIPGADLDGIYYLRSLPDCERLRERIAHARAHRRALDGVKVARPLTDLRIGPFYGCYIVRPMDQLRIDDEHPRHRYLHWVIEALGGTVVDYAGVYKCCGFPIITMNQEASLRQAGRHLGDALDAHADCLVTPCPLCHLNLDLQQPLAEKVVGRELGLPVLHLPQLVGLALGSSPRSSA